MKLPDVHGKRLCSKNFKRVDSHAANNINYDEKKKIIEIEYKNGGVYHYLGMDKNDWKKLLKMQVQWKDLELMLIKNSSQDLKTVMIINFTNLQEFDRKSFRQVAFPLSFY
jgi:hypothetical protein